MKKKHRYLDKHGMLLEGENGSKGDSILRTFYLYFITKKMWYAKKELLDKLERGIEACTHSIYCTNGILRHPDKKYADNTSQDAMIGWILFKYYQHNGSVVFRSIISELPRRISDEYKWSFAWWDWVQMMAGYTHGTKFLWSTIFYSIIHWHVWPLKWLGVKKGKYYKFGFYNLHLTAWMLYHMDSTRLLHKVACWFVGVAIPKENYLIRLLLRKPTGPYLGYPRRGWWWERLPWVKYHGIDNSVITTYDDLVPGWEIDTDIITALRPF